MWIIRKLGSLSFAIWVSVLLMLLLIVTTVLESMHGTPFVQKIFYQTKWFDFFLSLLCINIICSTILRFPFKSYHTGFVITHIGIVGLLAGALVTRLFGIEGQLLLFEGKAANVITSGEYQLEATLVDHENRTFDLTPGNYQLPKFQNDLEVSVRVLDHAIEEPVVSEGDDTVADNRAIRVNVQSKKLGIDQDFWLVESRPRDSHSNATSVGPLKVVLNKGIWLPEVKVPTLRIFQKSGEELATINLTRPFKKEMLLQNTDFRITGLEYYPFAKVYDGKIINKPQGNVLNPAVKFEISDSKGNTSHFLKFAFYPDFGATGEKAVTKNMDILIKFDAPARQNSLSHGETLLTFLVDSKGKWRYRINRSDDEQDMQRLNLHKRIPLGKMDMTFQVEKILKKAVYTTKIVDDSNSEQGVFAAEVRVVEGEKQYSQWLGGGQKVGFRTPQGNIFFKLNAKTQKLPFTLLLKNFRKMDYPGTRNPFAFESDVVLTDAGKNDEIHKTISMNNPLDYKGFRIFQSSYIQDPEKGTASIFTVAKNPGIIFIYISSCIIFIGAFLQFYIKRFSRNTGVIT